MSETGQPKQSLNVPVKIKYAKRFSITEVGDCKLLKIKKPNNSIVGLEYTYLLVPKGSPVPDGFADAHVIYTPVNTMACAGGEMVTFAEILGEYDKIIGVGTRKWIGNPRIHQKLDEGSMQEFGRSFNINLEVLVKLNPDITFVHSSGKATDTHEKIKQLGLNPGLYCGNLEEHPLGHLEWIKYMAAFLHKDSLANAYFDSVEQKYLTVKSLTNAIQSRPKVIAGHNRKGAWTTHGSSAWFVQYILDAGGNYILEDSTEYDENIISLEVALQKGLNADYWVNPQYEAESLSEIVSHDKRYEYFKCVQTGNVFNNTAFTFPNGRSRFWETGVTEPDIILADMIRIFHPDLLPDHKPKYYKRLK